VAIKLQKRDAEMRLGSDQSGGWREGMAAAQMPWAAAGWVRAGGVAWAGGITVVRDHDDSVVCRKC